MINWHPGFSRVRSIAKLVATGAAVAILVGGAGLPRATAQGTAAAPDSAVERGHAALSDIQSALIDIAQKLEPAVVHVEAEIPASSAQRSAGPAFPFGPEIPGPRPQSGPGLASGSGIIIDPNGTIITNRHVVEGASRVTVTLTDHRIFQGKVYSDPNVDLAVILIKATGLPCAKLGDSNNLKIGQWALAIGYPFDVGESVSKGIISALGRSQTIEGKFYPDLIQTDASINPGNSGGALVNIDGEVIGINTAIAGEAAQSAGIGFAIPSSTVELVAPQLAMAPHKVVNYPKGWIRGRLGVQVRPVTPDLVKILGVDQGALVAEVQADSPAARAGIQAGDVITKVNDKVVRDASELVDDISDIGPGKPAVLSIVRDKKQIVKTVITGTFGGTATSASANVDNHLGLSVQTLTPDIRGDLKLPDDVKGGAVVTDVQGGSPADAAGFQQGDVICQINDTPINSAEDYSAAVAAAKPGDSIGVKVYRGPVTAYLVMQIPQGDTGNN